MNNIILDFSGTIIIIATCLNIHFYYIFLILWRVFSFSSCKSFIEMIAVPKIAFCLFNEHYIYMVTQGVLSLLKE